MPTLADLASATPTPTASPTLAITPTATPLPFYFAYLIPTPTAYGAVEPADADQCERAANWLPYEVKAGDTLLTLALAAGSDLIELRRGNCFAPTRGIFAGELVLVPQLPQAPIAQPAPVFDLDDQAAVVIGCDHPSAQILAPQPLARVAGLFAIRGRASTPAGGRYRIALKPAWSDEYHTHLVSEQSAQNEQLALVNTEAFGRDLHRIRLSAHDDAGLLIEGGLCDIPVIFGSP